MIYKTTANMDDPKVQKLKKRLEDNRDARAAYQRVYEKLHLYTAQIAEAPQKTRYPFWCNECDSDFFGIGYKVVRRQRAKLPIAWYVAYCPMRHKCIRRITDRNNDQYLVKSVIVRRDRVRFRDELLTPDDPRFWLLYGHKHGFDGFKNLHNYKKVPAHELLREKRGR